MHCKWHKMNDGTLKQCLHDDTGDTVRDLTVIPSGAPNAAEKAALEAFLLRTKQLPAE